MIGCSLGRGVVGLNRLWPASDLRIHCAEDESDRAAREGITGLSSNRYRYCIGFKSKVNARIKPRRDIRTA